MEFYLAEFHGGAHDGASRPIWAAVPMIYWPIDPSDMVLLRYERGTPIPDGLARCMYERRSASDVEGVLHYDALDVGHKML